MILKYNSISTQSILLKAYNSLVHKFLALIELILLTKILACFEFNWNTVDKWNKSCKDVYKVSHN